MREDLRLSYRSAPVARSVSGAAFGYFSGFASDKVPSAAPTFSSRFASRIKPEPVSRLARIGALIGALIAPLLATAETLPPLRVVFGEEITQDQCKGIAESVLQEALTKRNGIIYTCETLPWERAQLVVKNGERDAFVATQNDERASYAIAGDEPALAFRMVMFTNANHPKLPELRNIKELSDAIPFLVLTYRGDGWAKNNLLPAGIKVEWSEGPSSVLKKLASGRGDLFFQTDIDTLMQIKQLKLEKEVMALPNEFGKAQLYLMIGKHSPYVDMQPKFDAAFQAMRKDGTLEKIYNQFK